MATFNGRLKLDYLFNELSEGDAAASGGPIVHRAVQELLYEFTDGTTAPSQNDIVWSDRNTVAASGTNTIDLGTGGGLVNRYGESLVPFVKVTLMLLVNRNTTATDILRFGPHSSNGFTAPWNGTTPLVHVQPGASAATPGILLMVNPHGWTVTDGSADVLRIVEVGAANTVTYDVMIVGRSA